MLSCFLIFLMVKIKNTKLSQCLYMIRLSLKYFLVVWDRSIFVIRELLKSLAEAKVCIQGLWIDFNAVLEIFPGSLTLV